MRIQSILMQLIIVTTLSSATASSVLATDNQPLTSIQAAAEQHVRSLLPGNPANLYIQAEKLDSRLRLNTCLNKLEAFVPNGANLAARATVGVRCTDNGGWTIYVPVKIESDIAVLALTRAVTKGDIIKSGDVEVRTQRVAGVGNNFLSSAAELSGKRAKRALPAGTVLNPGMLEAELLIKRGQQVTVIATVAGIEVRTQAVAQSDGALMSRIRVKNVNSAKVIEGTVETDAMVRVQL